MKIKVVEIVDFLSDYVINIFGDYQNKFVDNVSNIENANESTLDWVNITKQNKEEIIVNSKSSVFLVDPSVKYTTEMFEKQKILLVVENPRLILSKIISKYFISKKVACIHPSAIVDPEAKIDSDVFIGAGCVIGKSIIGKSTVLMPNVVVLDGVTIGERCLIQPGVVIGTDGLGCNRDKDGTLVKFPHLGGVIIGDDVEIGANCQIARGALSDTYISNGCKINGMCFIAHNCFLDENVWITGSSMLCGSTYVEKNVTIYSNVIIREQSRIGERAVIGMGSVVTKNVPPHEIWIGSPAKKKE